MHSIKISGKTLKFRYIEVNKKIYTSKQPIALSLVIVDQILLSYKFKHSNYCFKYFIGYKEDNITRPLCIILPEIREYIKNLENGGKHMSFIIKDDSTLVKYNEIGNKITKAINTKFHSIIIKGKVWEINVVIKKNFVGDKNQNKVWITCIYKNSPKVYLEECKNIIIKIRMPEFIDAKLDSDSNSDSE